MDILLVTPYRTSASLTFARGAIAAAAAAACTATVAEARLDAGWMQTGGGRASDARWFCTLKRKCEHFMIQTLLTTISRYPSSKIIIFISPKLVETKTNKRDKKELN